MNEASGVSGSEWKRTDELGASNLNPAPLAHEDSDTAVANRALRNLDHKSAVTTLSRSLSAVPSVEGGIRRVQSSITIRKTDEGGRKVFSSPANSPFMERKKTGEVPSPLGRNLSTSPELNRKDTDQDANDVVLEKIGTFKIKGGFKKMRIVRNANGHNVAFLCSRTKSDFTKLLMEKEQVTEVIPEIEKKAGEMAEQAKKDTLKEYQTLQKLHDPSTRRGLTLEAIQPMPNDLLFYETDKRESVVAFTALLCEGDGEFICGTDPESGVNVPPEERQKIGRQILEAMAYAHSLGIYHLDPAPKNLLVGRFNEKGEIDKEHGKWKVYVADWGGSQTAEVPLEDLWMVGTRDFIAWGDTLALNPEIEGHVSPDEPERYKEYLDKRDVFGTAKMLFQVLVDTLISPFPLFQEENSEEVPPGFPNLSPEAIMFQDDPDRKCTYKEFLEEGLPAFLNQIAEFSEPQAKALAELLKESFNPNWEKRPSMEEFHKRYDAILALK